MGLSIHYYGRLNDPSRVIELITEVADISKSLSWSFQIIKEPNSDKLNGICIDPEGCEPIFLTFLEGGKLCSPLNLMCRDINEKGGVAEELLYTVSTKTQFAGFDAHVAIIKLFRYLKRKYFEVFEMIDEGMYWETNDEIVLRKQFDNYESLLNTVENELGEMTVNPGEGPSYLAGRIEKLLKKKFNNEEDKNKK